MKIVIAGASGFLGRTLISTLRGHDVVALVRHGESIGHAKAVVWNGLRMDRWADEIDGADAVVNFAGSPTSERWTGESMRIIKESRVQTTYLLGQAINGAERPPHVWINASSAAIYGSRGAEILDENSTPGSGFMADIWRIVEDVFAQEKLPTTRRVSLRSGFVLGRDGGPLKPLVKRAKMFMGGSNGDGNQWMPWIHAEDHAAMILWLIENAGISGPVNACGVAPCLNSTFMETLRGVCGRPLGLSAPSFRFGKSIDEESETTLASVRALPKVAQAGGFRWQHPSLESALKDVCSTAKAEIREKVSMR